MSKAREDESTHPLNSHGMASQTPAVVLPGDSAGAVAPPSSTCTRQVPRFWAGLHSLMARPITQHLQPLKMSTIDPGFPLRGLRLAELTSYWAPG